MPATMEQDFKSKLPRVQPCKGSKVSICHKHDRNSHLRKEMHLSSYTVQCHGVAFITTILNFLASVRVWSQDSSF
ncbi:Uncharacterised protein [Porphyromonas crevioricanis]|uniref:Uncharacterized protein n=1 Tax=Porphyromonas crevioricanis TaxID=393921 RepID=A0A2X4PLC8_9PORP|nr:hypothetical protein SAMN02745203_01123 [Porphyromonas crevioricanis]SQH73165.1 Uncharacterised protein [Porphyromonas crevioricanis]